MSAGRPDILERALQGGSRGLGLTGADVAVALAALLAAALLAAFTWSGGLVQTDDADGDDAGLYAVVQNAAGFYQVLPLAQDTGVTVASDLGTNVVEVADGRVRVGSSDCANQVCVNQGWAAAEGTVICCLPHKLTVEVVADPNDATPLVL